MSGNRNRILLVGVDGIGLSDLKTYQLKNFQSVLRHGASGRINNASSLPITTAWTGLATGCSANKHGILSDSTIDESSDRTRAVGPADWNRPPIWDLLDGNGLLTHRFNMPARHPEQEQDHCLSISPLFFNQLKSNSLQTRRSVQPIDFFDAAKTLAITPAHVDRATLELFIPDIGNPQTAQFPEVGKMAGSIASNLSIQAIAGQIITELDWNLFMIRFSLADEINRILARAEHASSHFENAREAAFRTLNLCLGSFRRLAGNHTLVLCSMHGEGGGFVAFEGSNIKSGEKLLGPRPEDVAPTLLNLLGLSQSSQMNGRVLDELFRTHPATDLCPPSPNLSTYEVPTEEESAWLLEPFEINQAPWRIDVQANQRKAEAHLKLGQWFDALPHLLEQHVAAPFSLQHALPVCRVLFLSGLVAEAAELMIQTAELHPTAPISPLLKALAAYHTGLSAEAEKWMESYNGHQAINPDWKLFLAEIYLHLKQPETALSQLVELLDDSPDHTLALILKAEILITLNRASEAAEAAARAIETDFSSERAHLTHSRALLLQNRKEEARSAVVAALKINPESADGLVALAACIEDEEPWGAEMMRARSGTSAPERLIESRRWQYRLFLEDAYRKNQLGHARLLHPEEAQQFIQEHLLPLGHLEQTEAIVVESEYALLKKPMLSNEPARVEFFSQPSPDLLQGVLERCRRLRIKNLRTWSLREIGSPLFQSLEEHGFSHWMEICQYQINGASAFEQMKPLIERIPLPDQASIVPLNHLSWEAVRYFIARHIPISDDLLGPDGLHNISAELSAVALFNNRIVGVFINRINRKTVHCPYLAVDPAHRNSWVVPHLFKAVGEIVLKRGFDEMEFMTHPEHFPAMHAMLQRLEPENETVFLSLEIAVA